MYYFLSVALYFVHFVNNTEKKIIQRKLSARNVHFLFVCVANIYREITPQSADSCVQRCTSVHHE